MLKNAKKKLKSYLTWHVPGEKPNVFIVSMPRSGSTWLMELVLTQPGFMSCNEPLNLDKQEVRDNLQVTSWAQLHDDETRRRLQAYIGGFCSGKLRDWRYNRPGPFSGFYRPVTNRIVFKFIAGGHEHIDWLAETFNGRVLYLLRHPIPVSLSRQRFPLLDVALQSRLTDFLSSDQQTLTKRIISAGSKLERGVLDWAIQNHVAMTCKTESWTLVTYEQLVVDPMPLIRHLSDRLSLPAPARIANRLHVPSGSTSLSDQGTQATLSTARDRRSQQWLVEKWQANVDGEDLARAGEVLAAFHLDNVYSATEALPSDNYWIG